ncbi:hypothetical protein PFICI_12730 [Pestalotiopsis fici W106-1]|uniref:BZIP domain-containing protein n=1 Tax=Pestalotiopsis fici (strain W106-1 / CGMCC3.15140) TaxID=1229662 RepID=W3WSI3_PESFW|nr:uncharacterized protein PFICI_12730 [Pestalotiopsis fici W106-1]ETS75786.1 hypothetical protein PFICI_12730 [Pestalotiopsis fici W106-1]
MASNITSATSNLTQSDSIPSEVWDTSDDLATIVDSAERRRVQNRLHQRLYRRRRHLRRIESVQAARANNVPASAFPRHDENHLSSLESDYVLSQLFNLPLVHAIREPRLRQATMTALQAALARWSLNAPHLNDLPTIARLNVFDALVRNSMVLQIPAEFLESDDGVSLFNVHQPYSSGPSPIYPNDLAPTSLQMTVPHHPWVDLLPIPALRDNILRCVETGDYDEDFLCNGICCDMLTTDWTGTGQLIIWGEPWNANNWEFSEEFFRNWAFLLNGCMETLETTNYWRQKRGEMRLDFILNP